MHWRSLHRQLEAWKCFLYRSYRARPLPEVPPWYDQAKVPTRVAAALTGQILWAAREVFAALQSGQVNTIIFTELDSIVFTFDTIFMYSTCMKTYPYLAESIANTLEKFRNSKNINKSSLADFADIQRSYLRDIVKGNRKPTVNTIFCLCEALHIDPVIFFHEVVKEIKKLEKTQ